MNTTDITEANEKLFTDGLNELSDITDAAQNKVDDWIEQIDNQIVKSGKSRTEYDFKAFTRWMLDNNYMQAWKIDEDGNKTLDLTVNRLFNYDLNNDRDALEQQEGSKGSAFDATNVLASFQAYDAVYNAKLSMAPVLKKLGFKTAYKPSSFAINPGEMYTALAKANCCTFGEYSHYNGPMGAGEALAFSNKHAAYGALDQWMAEFKDIQEQVDAGVFTWNDYFAFRLKEAKDNGGNWSKYNKIKDTLDEQGIPTGHFDIVMSDFDEYYLNEDRFITNTIGQASNSVNYGCVPYEKQSDFKLGETTEDKSFDDCSAKLVTQYSKISDGIYLYEYDEYVSPDFDTNKTYREFSKRMTYYTPERLAQYYLQFLNEKGINTAGYEQMAKNYAIAAKADLTKTHLISEHDSGHNTYETHFFDETTKYYVNTSDIDKDIETLKKQVSNLEKLLNDSKEELNRSNANIKDMDKEINDVRSSMTEDNITKQIEAKQAEKNTEISKQQEAIEKIAKCKDLISQLEKEIQQNTADIAELTDKRDAVDLGAAQAKVDELNKNLNDAKQLLEDAVSDKNKDQQIVDKLNKAVEAIQSEIDKLSSHLNAIVKAENAIEEYDKNLSANKDKVNVLKSKLNIAKDKVTAADNELKKSVDSLEKIKKQSQSMIDKAQAVLNEAQAKLDEAKANYKKAEQEYIAAVVALQMAQDDEASRVEGEKKAVVDKQKQYKPKHMRETPETSDILLFAPALMSILGSASVFVGKKKEKESN